MADERRVVVGVNDLFFYTKIRDACRDAFVLERARTESEITEKASSERPVAVVLNLNDEKFDAFRAVEELKRNPTLTAIPILAFANHEDVEAWKRAKALGVQTVVSRNEFSARTRALVEAVAGVREEQGASSAGHSTKAETAE